MVAPGAWLWRAERAGKRERAQVEFWNHPDFEKECCLALYHLKATARVVVSKLNLKRMQPCGETDRSAGTCYTRDYQPNGYLLLYTHPKIKFLAKEVNFSSVLTTTDL